MFHIKKKRLFCAICGKGMVKAFTDAETFKEMSLDGDVIEVRHVYYGCPSCETIARLRFRVDGQKGDLARIMEAREIAVRHGLAPEPVRELPGEPFGMEDA